MVPGAPDPRESNDMTSIDVFYQGEGIREIAHFEADPAHTFAIVKLAIVEKHGLEHETLIFLEDSDEPVDEQCFLREHIGRAGIKAHLHRCRHIAVEVTFNGEIVHHRFGPGTTVNRVKKWAAEHEFGMISGSTDRPDPGTHLGAIVSCPDCRIAFDLVPNERVNGF
jgi:hypothetical protein